MQLTGTVTPELRKVRFLTVRQVYFNLNGKLDCKVLSSLKVFMYIYARLVAHRSTQIERYENKGIEILIQTLRSSRNIFADFAVYKSHFQIPKFSNSSGIMNKTML